MDNKQLKVSQKINRDYIIDIVIGQIENRYSYKLGSKYMQYQFRKKVDKFIGKIKIDIILS